MIFVCLDSFAICMTFHPMYSWSYTNLYSFYLSDALFSFFCFSIQRFIPWLPAFNLKRHVNLPPLLREHLFWFQIRAFSQQSFLFFPPLSWFLVLFVPSPLFCPSPNLMHEFFPANSEVFLPSFPRCLSSNPVWEHTAFPSPFYPSVETHLVHDLLFSLPAICTSRRTSPYQCHSARNTNIPFFGRPLYGL